MAQNIQDKLALMQQSFKVKLQNVATNMRTWDSAEQFEELLSTCHKYGGSAGTFGLAKTSEQLKKFELKLKQLPHPISDEEAVKLYKDASVLLECETRD